MEKYKLPLQSTENCTRIVHFRAQTNNGPSVDGALYNGGDNRYLNDLRILKAI